MHRGRRAKGRRGLFRNLMLVLAGTMLFVVGYLVGSRYMDPFAEPSPLVLLGEPVPLRGFELRDAAGQPFGPDELRGRWQLLIPYRADRAECQERVVHSVRIRNRLAGETGSQAPFGLLYVRTIGEAPGDTPLAIPLNHPAIRVLGGEAADTRELLRQIGLADPARQVEPCRSAAPYAVIDDQGALRALAPVSLAPEQAAEALIELMTETGASTLNTAEPGLKDRTLTTLLKVLPQHQLSAAMHWLARLEWPPLKNALIRFVVARYGINVDEAANTDLDSYPSFNAFFTRGLRADARPLDKTPGALLSPVDGRISQIGRIEAGRLLQAKGVDYSLQDLLGGDPELTRSFDGGHFATVYLSPRDYHRIHMPTAGTLRRMDFVPGELFSVSEATVRLLPNLFARNERTVSIFDGERGSFAVVLVGAIFVASMETVWHGEVRAIPRGRITRWDYDRERPPSLEAGDEMGRFNMGSTVILLFPPGQVEWEPRLKAGDAVRLGERLGRFVA